MTNSVFFLLQIFSLIIVFFYLTIFNKKKFINLIVIIFATLYILSEIFSLYLTRSFIDYRIYAVIDFNSLKIFFSQFYLYLIFFIISAVLIIIINYFLVKFLKKKNLIKFKTKIILTPLFLISVFFLMQERGSFYEKKNIVNLFKEKEIQKFKNFEKSSQIQNNELNTALSDIGFNNYVFNYKKKSNLGKNIIVIKLESLEESFFNKNLNFLIPNLIQIRKNNYFYKLKQEKYTGWTAAMLYGLFTGFPSIFYSKAHNNILDNVKNIRINNLADILDNSNYQISYLIGNADFAGTRKFLETLGVNVIDKRNTKDYLIEKSIGLNDLDLFKEAKKEVLKLHNNLKNKSEKFAFFIQSSNSHFPNGIYDKRMKSKINFESENIDFSFKSLDYLLGDFYKFLIDQNILDNTLLLILPDHRLQGGSKVFKILNTQKERNLFLISNLPIETNKEIISNLELPRVILETANIDNNAKFLSDIHRDLDSFIKNNFTKIARVNDLANNFINFKNGLNIEIIKDKIKLSNSKNEVFYNLEKDKIYFNITFDKNFTPVSFTFSNYPSLKTKYTYAGGKKNYYDFLIKYKEQKIIEAYLVNKENILSEKFRIENNRLIIKKNYISNLINRNNVSEKIFNDQNRYIAHAGGAINGEIYTNSLEALNYSYKNGFKLFELDIQKTSDNKYVAVHSWKEWAKIHNFKKTLPPTEKEFMSFKINNNYTPLNIEMINKWFNERKDAILITDKINEPKRFVNLFKFKNRLRMELFTENAINEAIDNGVTPIPNYYTLKNIKNPVNFLKKNKIEYVAASRASIEETENSAKNIIKNLLGMNLLQKLKNNNIKIYAFNINYEKYKDEKYTICNENNYFYGIYADYWTIPNKYNCN